MIKNILIASSLVGLASCGTILSGSDQGIVISAYENGTEVRGAKCKVDNGSTVTNITTPRNVMVDKSKEDLVVTCQKNNVNSDTSHISSEFNITSAIGILFDLGLITMTTDFITGAAWEYPKRVDVNFPDKVKAEEKK